MRRRSDISSGSCVVGAILATAALATAASGIENLGTPRIVHPNPSIPRDKSPSPTRPSASSHWSFKPISNPSPPTVKGRSWARNPIDRFILSKLDKEGVAPSPEADRATLIRRLSVDLTGLPPGPAEVGAFLADRTPNAYDRLVDRLLKSPHFGERWGRHWLDLARYADSDGYEKDNVRPWAWRWRNWVIDAINSDMPFDQFTIEQLAGDLLPNATLDQKIATGFHRNTLTNTEGGTDQEEFRVKANVDRVNTTGTIWMGLTVSCAQCHDHKYDPLSQAEYYQLFSFFNGLSEVNIPAALPAEQAEYEKAKLAFDAARSGIKAKIDLELAAIERDALPGRRRAWELDAARTAVRWVPRTPSRAVSENGAELKALSDGSVLATGKSPDSDTYSLSFVTDGTPITAIRIEAMTDDRLPSKGPGRTAHGNFVINEVRLSVETGGGAGAAISLKDASADYSQQRFTPAGAFDNDPTTGWAVGGQEGKTHVLVARAERPVVPATGGIVTVSVVQRHGGAHTIGRLRLSTTASATPAVASLTGDAVTEALTTPETQRTPEQRAALSSAHRAQDPDVKRLEAEIAKLDASAPKAPPTLAQTLVEGTTKRKTYVMMRGDFQRPGQEVRCGTPATMNPLSARSADPTRLDLANWLVDPANPLTSRVTVNRVWMHLFGRGIVGTVDDFGTRGEKPTHPELLDWLARAFMKDGGMDAGSTRWSLKSLIRLIVTSATYRQSSRYRPELAGRDANNLWLARQNRFRFEAEGVRDAYLTASGLLNRTVGGPSVRPPLPPGIAELGYAGSVRWQNSSGPDRYRRGLYIFFQRTVPYPMLVTFDTPDMNVCAAKRERSNTPLQALTLLNDPVFVECARALGQKAMVDAPPSTAGRVRFLFASCLGRSPTPSEQAEALAAYEKMRRLAERDFDAAAELTGEHLAPERQTIEQAAWTAIARVIMNLDEFVTRE